MAGSPLHPQEVVTVPDGRPENGDEITAVTAVRLALVLPPGAVEDGHPVARMREVLADEIEAARTRGR